MPTKLATGSESPSARSIRILVAIASFGTGNDAYLRQLIAEYLSMPYKVEILVLSNIPKPVPPGSQAVVVDLKGKDPWSLPFDHKQIFADRIDDYDLFIYSEDDTLVSQKNIEAFLNAYEILPENEIAGFFRFERDAGGQVNYPEAHGRFHWDSRSVRRRGSQIFAAFTNEHSACYAVTRAQLRRAIDSGGYLVPPHSGKYDLLCSAATDPYTQCGFEKVVAITNFDDFLVHHLPNRYIGSKFGVGEAELRQQLETLVRFGQNGECPGPLFPGETRLLDRRYSRDYYQPADHAILSMIPASVRSVLSIGCGSGATELALVRKGLRVVALPMDPVIASAAKSGGVEVVDGSIAQVRDRLAHDRFDCLLSLDMLHLVDDPGGLLASFSSVLREGGTVVLRIPRISRVRGFLLRMRGDKRAGQLGDYESTGVHCTSPKIAKRWIEKGGLRLDAAVRSLRSEESKLPQSFGWLANLILADSITVVATKA